MSRPGSRRGERMPAEQEATSSCCGSLGGLLVFRPPSMTIGEGEAYSGLRAEDDHHRDQQEEGSNQEEPASTPSKSRPALTVPPRPRNPGPGGKILSGRPRQPNPDDASV
jgi:hypothetical protein